MKKTNLLKQFFQFISPTAGTANGNRRWPFFIFGAVNGDYVLDERENTKKGSDDEKKPKESERQ